MLNDTIFNFRIYNLFYFFTAYALLGWISEVIFAAFKNKRFVNRGFLNGPFCPIYGFGMLILIVFLNPVKNNILLLFLGAVILTSILEYLTGFILEKAFKSTWWDYSNEPLNIKGRICIRFSILWGVLAVIILKLIHPHIKYAIELIPWKAGSIIIYIIFSYFITDLVITIHSVVKLNSLLKQLHAVKEELLAGAARLKEIAEDKAEVKVEDIEERLTTLKAKYELLFERRTAIHSRIILAFPNLKSNKFDSILKDLKDKIETRI